MKSLDVISLTSTSHLSFSTWLFWVKLGSVAWKKITKNTPIVNFVTILIIFTYLLKSGFKKYHGRKISRQGKLKEMVVGNFLNIMTVSCILVMTTILTFALSYHFRYNHNIQLYRCPRENRHILHSSINLWSSELLKEIVKYSRILEE